ncbi:hypothetical protein JF780_05695 [Mycobacterium intracellulare]|uniref:hypothetical protein n=1 Tax=Mycobacterium intracellulare TaxID=1767 RepID=UPI00192780CD|nr:hypothetical protein [Mycobacterium intracellulare]MCA2275484.1 hypothetical protein [Mycobacterium intracellulare]MCA2324444.1 hypothetical protein [Mycobacterium intracellulare]BCP29588.1 hypothetical protein MINTM026_05580 [Mycobacterium intracellulare]
MSVELRIVCDRPDDCTLGVSKPIRDTDHCNHQIGCDWGAIRNSEVDTRRPIEHLMLVTPDVVERMLEHGPEIGTRGGLVSCTEDDGRKFFHLEYDDKRWTWELFDAHWWDDEGPEIYVGRWPD